MLLANRPRHVVAGGILTEGQWTDPPDDLGAFWAPDGPAPTYTWETDEDAPGTDVLHITHSPGEDVESVDVLFLEEPLDLTDREGCWISFRAAGQMTGSTKVAVALFMDGDHANAFGGTAEVTRHELTDTDGFVSLSGPINAQGQVEVALRVETRKFSENEIDLRIADWKIDCWNPEHGQRDYGYWAGTSFATPLVAGVAALVASAEPDLDTMQIRQAILDSVVELPSLEGLVATGGRVDAYGALLRAAELADESTDDAGVGETTLGAPTAGPLATGIVASSHEGYESPAPGETEPVSTGRGAPDPAASTGGAVDPSPTAESTDEAAAAPAEDRRSPIQKKLDEGVPPWQIGVAVVIVAGVIVVVALAPDPKDPLTWIPGGKATKILKGKPKGVKINPATGKPIPPGAQPGFIGVGGSGKGPKKPTPPKQPSPKKTEDAGEKAGREGRTNPADERPGKQAKDYWDPDDDPTKFDTEG